MSGRTVSRIALAGLLAATLATPAVAQEGGFQVPLNAEPVVPEVGLLRAVGSLLSKPVTKAPLTTAAPMPRAKANIEIEFSVELGGGALLFPRQQPQGGFNFGLAVAPKPREIASYCWQCLRDDVYMLAQMAEQLSAELQSDRVMSEPVPPELPVAPMTAPVSPVPATVCVAPGIRIAVPQLGPVGLELDFACPLCSPTDHRQLFNFGVGVFGGSSTLPACPPSLAGGFGSCQVPMLPRHYAPLPQRQTFTFSDAPRIVLVGENELVCPPCPFPAAAPNPLLGTWYRDSGVGMVGVTFTHDEMKLCLTQRDGGKTAVLTITAHYSITKDGLVYGAITSADVDVKQDGKAENGIGMELAELSLALQELADRPFSFRTKLTSTGLMVSHLKAAPLDGVGGMDFQILGGLYKSAKDGRVPAPTSLKLGGSGRADCQAHASDLPIPSSPYPPLPALPSTERGAVVGGAIGPMVGATIGASSPNVMREPIQRVGIDFNASEMIQPLPPAAGYGPVYIVPPPPMPPRVVPRSALPIGSNIPNDSTRDMAEAAFGQMLWSAGPLPGVTPPPGLPQFTEGTVPAGTPTGSYIVLPAGAVPVASAPQLKPGHMGTWVRTIGSKQCVVKVEADHLTVTISETHESNGKTVIGHLTFTADYYLTRDGLTAVGLITSVDMKFDGDLPEDDADAMLEKLGDLQKAMEEKPFAMTFRRYGEALVIGNVRMPTTGDRVDAQMTTFIGGRYASAGDKPLPKLKTAKATETKGPPLVGLPGTPAIEWVYPDRYNLAPRPVEFVIPAPPVQGVVPSVAPSGSLPMTEPAPPAIQMVEPIPPAISADVPKQVRPTEMAVAWRNQIASSPDPTRNGAPGTGLTGQLFLFGGPKLEFAEPNGTLTVDLVDETPRAVGQQTATSERWQFDKVTLNKLLTNDEKTFGKSYALFLPWSGYTPDVTRVRISARFDAEGGNTLFAPPSVVVLRAPKEAVLPSMPTPVKPVGFEENADKGVSVELGKQLRREWSWFWFKDRPSHLTPERIHGGIY